MLSTNILIIHYTHVSSSPKKVVIIKPASLYMYPIVLSSSLSDLSKNAAHRMKATVENHHKFIIK